MELFQGSFAGIEFHTSSNGGDFGRRIAKHQYPYRNSAYIEDLGAKPQSHRMEIFVLGDNHIAQRDQLLRAFRAGQGELMHPHYGSMIAIAEQVRAANSSTHQRQTKLSVTFVVVQDAAPQPVVDTYAQFQTSKTSALTAVQTSFEQGFAAPKTELEQSETANDVQSLVSNIRNLNGRVSAFIAPIDSFARDIVQLGDEVSSLIRTPNKLAASLVSVALAAIGAVNDIRAAFASLGVARASMVFGSNSTNSQPLRQLSLATLAIAHADQLVQIVHNQPNTLTRTDAESLLTTTTAAIKQAQAQADDASYRTLADLMANTVATVAASQPDMAELVIAEQPHPVPTLVLAYQHAGTIVDEDAINNRNNIAHPLFATGRIEITRGAS